MATYGPHNLRWTGGPQGADIIGSIGADPMIAEYPAEVFGSIMEDIMGNEGMSKGAREEIGGLYNTFRPGADFLAYLQRKLDDQFTKGIPGMLGRQKGLEAPSKLKDLSMHGMNQGLSLIEMLQNLANNPEISQLGNKIIPSFVRGKRQANK